MLTENRILCGDARTVLATLPGDIVDLTVTSPPYFRHRDYGVSGQIGREKTLDGYVAKIQAVLAELLRVTAKTGACFFVVGDTYENQKLLLVPHRIALIEPIILACSEEGDLVLDPFAGSGTTCRIAARLGRRFLGIELNLEYAKMAARAAGTTVDQPLAADRRQ